MKRFKFTLKDRDYSSCFYCERAEDIIRSILYDEEIISYEEIPFLTFEENKIINHIKKEMEFKGCIRKSDTSFYEMYSNDNFRVRLLKIGIDKYYAYAEYQLPPNLTERVAWTVTNLVEIDRLLSLGDMEYIIVSRRFWGEPKLDKPKELKGIKSIGGVDFVTKHSKPLLFIKDNDLYIKHNDYFSYYWQPPKGERVDMPLSYYANKYFGKNRKEKFCYPDTWGSVIFRNEAWLCIKNAVGWIELKNNYRWSRDVFSLQKKYISIKLTGDVENSWLRFWEGCVNIIRANKLKNLKLKKENVCEILNKEIENETL